MDPAGRVARYSLGDGHAAPPACTGTQSVDQGVNASRPTGHGPKPAPRPAASRLTPARRRGLAVLLAGADADQPVYESNATSATDAVRLTVYWQTVDWLRSQGYVTTDRIGSLGGVRIYPTAAGLELAGSVA
jgi:hypothetical protein